MVGFCPLCENYFLSAKRRFCLECQEELSLYPFSEDESVATIESTRVMSLLPYKGILRELCLNVKVHSCLGNLEDLFSLSRSSPFLAELMEEVDVVLPVPSSLWGRIHGRLDLAGLLAAELCERWGKKLVYLPPGAYFWRLQKRALTSPGRKTILTWFKNSSFFRAFEVWLKDCLPQTLDLGNLRVLIVDDIVTTGLSLRQTAQRVTAGHILYFTLFRSKDP